MGKDKKELIDEKRIEYYNQRLSLFGNAKVSYFSLNQDTLAIWQKKLKVHSSKLFFLSPS